MFGADYVSGKHEKSTKKPVMSKKKVFVVRNLKDSYQIYHSDQQKEKRKSMFFYHVIKKH
jgi:hypothetical protein